MLRGSPYVLVLVVFNGEQIRVPRLFQRPPVDLILVLCRPHATPANSAILKLSALAAATVHLMITQAGEA